MTDTNESLIARIDALVTKLGAATKGGWDLSAEVLRVFGWAVDRNDQHMPDGTTLNAPEEYVLPAERIDDALTLMPKGWRLWKLEDRTWAEGGKWQCGLDTAAEHLDAWGEAKTAPLAVCIAVLLAYRSALVSRAEHP